jgi:putative endonuclease
VTTSGAGRAGEDAAVRYLEERGYRILRRNLRGPGAEIDMLAQWGSTYVFVEVKARGAGRAFGSALGAVDARKRKRIRALAADYVQFLPAVAEVRFDVITVEGGRLTHHEGAFA